MFTGIVTDVGEIVSIQDDQTLRRIRVRCGYDPASVEIGASIACSGACLTVVEKATATDGMTFDAELSLETLDLTTARDWAVGARINLERSLALGAELGGHLVTGHVDGIALVLEREQIGETSHFVFDAPTDLASFIAAKGSVALDGTSLTVNRVDGTTFEVMMIPHTLAVTTWGDADAGTRVNLEVDLVARYVARLQNWQAGANGNE